MNIEELAKKHDHDFPGYRLVDYYTAAFPAYVTQLQVLMQIQRPLPILEEFILKTIDAGITNISDIAGVLGIEYIAVEEGLDQLQRRDYVYFLQKETSVVAMTTNRGLKALRELYLTEPEPSSFSVCIDALTGAFFQMQPLSQPRDIKEQEIYEIPTYISTPKIEQIDFLSLKRLVADSQKDLAQRSQKRELVDLLSIEKNWTAYRRMRVLQYVREIDGAVLVQVFDKGERSIDHEAALIKMESEKLRPLRAVFKNQVPEIKQEDFSLITPTEITAARQVAVEKPKIQQEISTKTQILEQAKNLQSSELAQDRREATYQIEQLNEQITILETRLKEMEERAGQTEVLQMYEHRPKLIEALRIAKKQIIIVSPWLNTDAIDYELRIEIGKTLQKGVSIMIAYGFSEENWVEKESVKRLKDTAKNKKGNLKIYRVGDLHSKVLICDEEFMILTSFNWLSFAGDPTRGTRYEDGMLTYDKFAIKEKISEWTGRVSDLTPI